MKKIFLAGLTTVTLLTFGAISANANLIVNGSFEDPELRFIRLKRTSFHEGPLFSA